MEFLFSTLPRYLEVKTHSKVYTLASQNSENEMEIMTSNVAQPSTYTLQKSTERYTQNFAAKKQKENKSIAVGDNLYLRVEYCDKI